MQVITAQLISGRKVLLRYDIDVPLRQAQGHGQPEVEDDFRLKSGLATLKLCLENAQQVILMGHVGRPESPDPNFSVKPIYDWLVEHDLHSHMESGKLKLLENLRFEPGEDGCNLEYAKEILNLVEDDTVISEKAEIVYINEAFAAYHKASSTTVLPTLLPHAAGLRFAMEVKTLTEVRNSPKKPFVALIGGVKMGDKLEAIQVLAEKASAVLVGGKLASQVHEDSFNFPANVLAARLTAD